METGAPKIALYRHENETWQKILSAQCNEMPRLEELLTETKTGIDLQAMREMNQQLRDQLLLQKERADKLNSELEVQQQRLELGSNKDTLYDLHLLCAQDILRQRIGELQKRYHDLKSSFLNFMPAVL